MNDFLLEHTIDFAAIGTLGLVFLGFLPHITAVLTFVWVCIRLYETPTVQGLLKRIGTWRFG